MVIVAYDIDIYNKTLEFINNNNIQVQTYDPIEIYAKINQKFQSYCTKRTKKI